MIAGQEGEEGRRGFSVEESSLIPVSAASISPTQGAEFAEVLPSSIPWVQLLRGRPVVRSRWQLPDLNG